MTFFHATFVLVTFDHYFDENLQVGSWEHLEKIPTVTVTFVQATFVLVTFVHIYLSCY